MWSAIINLLCDQFRTRVLTYNLQNGKISTKIWNVYSFLKKESSAVHAMWLSVITYPAWPGTGSSALSDRQDHRKVWRRLQNQGPLVSVSPAAEHWAACLDTASTRGWGMNRQSHSQTRARRQPTGCSDAGYHQRTVMFYKWIPKVKVEIKFLQYLYFCYCMYIFVFL